MKSPNKIAWQKPYLNKDGQAFIRDCILEFPINLPVKIRLKYYRVITLIAFASYFL